MFKNLKSKLKNWIAKTDDEAEVDVVTEEAVPKEKTSKKKSASKKAAAPKGVPRRDKKSSKKKMPKEVEKIEEKLEEIEEVLGDLESEEEPSLDEEATKPKTKRSIFATKSEGSAGWRRKKLSAEKFEELFEELELILLQNNVALEAIESLKEPLKDKLVGDSAKANVAGALKEAIGELLQNPPSLIDKIKEKEGPFVILFTGINGAGKTTSIAKVTNYLKNNKLSVCLASADTFRAAAIEQLQVHADKLEVPLIKKDYGSDPASVGFDAIKFAKKNSTDVVLIDTAGRMNNRDSLMKEIEKIARVTSPDLKIFLGESITGNDATTQAKDFNNSIGIDGIILSKADVDEKGGTAISVSYVTNQPIYFLGVGQNYDDLEIFDKEKLLKKIMP